MATMPLIQVKPKAQITLPVKIRRALGIQEGDYLEAAVVGNRIVLTPQTVTAKLPEVTPSPQQSAEAGQAGPPIAVDSQALAAFCQRNQIRKLWLFGSVLREDFGPESDMDVLVEFEPDARVGLMGIARMELELSELIGRKVDLRTPEDLSPYFREQVLATAVLQYAA